ncbi:MAG: BMP family ABC transporter substrate-binding protein [Haliangiales bacterium]
MQAHVSTFSVPRLCLLAALLAAPLSAGCKESPKEAAQTGDPEAEGATAEQPAATPDGDLFVYVSPDPLGVNPFLIMGKTGIEAAAAKHGASAKVFESEDPTSRKDNLRAAVATGAKLVVVLGFAFNDIIVDAAKDSPEVDFLIVDQCVEEQPKNLHCATFREYEATFLLGAEAAELSRRDHLGVVAALDIPFMHRFTDGFAQGAKHVKPEIKVDVRWVGGENPFSDPVRAKEQALALHSAGADIVFAATSGGDFGIFEAAVEKNFRVMGVDVNMCPSASGRMYDSALKRLDTAMVEAIDAILGGAESFSGSYGLKEGGGGLVGFEADLAKSGCLIAEHPEVISKAKALRDELIAGTLKLEDPMFAGQ